MRNLQTLLLLNVFAPEEIGARIAQARDEAGLTQQDLAEMLDVTTRTVQNYEAGTTKPFKKIQAISGATSRSVEWLLHGDPATAPGSPEEIQKVLTVVEETKVDVRELRELVQSLLEGLAQAN